VAGQHLTVVEPVDVVGAEDQDDLGVVLGDQLAVAPDGVGVALVEAVLLPRPELGWEQPQASVGPVQVPGATVGQLVVERLEPILLQHPDVLDPGMHAVGQREVDQPEHAGEGDGRLGPPVGEQLQPAPLTAGHDEGEHLGLGHRLQDRAGDGQYQPWETQNALAFSAVP
jgi:hypothetical protein